MPELDKILEDLWKRADKDASQEPSVRTITSKQIQNALVRSGTTTTSGSIKNASTEEWEVSPLMSPGRFLLLKRDRK